ncbi:nucleoside hydrolase [Nakamurella sp. YIM 132087]|uniref:Nucleoside hydrolase n=1 Tax=Nakamurella alba TaxID=2665158 RepID=A0A7K1FQ64_9ACTN|nr:nucleoside hydrolase [Nakamurella alba]MTD16286.1 nucleoside hydrolase [Nakamurella alba]
MVDRRTFLQVAGVASGVIAGGTLSATAAGAAAPTPAAAGPLVPTSAWKNPNGPVARVLVVNDNGGDPDGLVSTAHAVLSSGGQVVGIVASRKVYRFAPNPTSADQAKAKTDELLKVMGIKGIKTYAGSMDAMTAVDAPKDSAGARAIIAEANRTDTTLPLYVTVGGALTDVASALQLDPSIAGKFTLIWIGGAAYPAGGAGETNSSDDPIAAQSVFNNSTVHIWQVPIDVYSQALVGMSEFQLAMLPCGKAGGYLFNEITARIGLFRLKGDSYCMGDNPLVLLSAQNQVYDNAGSNGKFVVRPAPTLNADLTYTDNPAGRPIRVYTSIDTHLMFNDFYAKMLLKYAKR